MKQYKKIMIVVAVGVVTLAVISLFNRADNKKGEIEQGQKLEATTQEAFTLTFFQEEVLTFLSASMVDTFKEQFSMASKEGGENGTSCCVVLSNITALSQQTYRFYVQTNESQNNIYQVIINEAANMVDIERWSKEIADIESYGGVGFGDSIERIYIYNISNEENSQTVPMTLDEETAAKEKEYQDKVEEMEEAK